MRKKAIKKRVCIPFRKDGQQKKYMKARDCILYRNIHILPLFHFRKTIIKNSPPPLRGTKIIETGFAKAICITV